MNPTQNQVTKTTVTPATILRGAALYLSRHGWTQRQFYVSRGRITSPACVLGALYVAATGQQCDSTIDCYETDPVLTEAVGALESELSYNACGDDEGLAVDAWNDQPGQTAKSVIDRLLDAADIWDAEHSLSSSQYGDLA